jgi:hypothetical protein
MENNISDFHDACRTVLLNRSLPALNYAVGYASAGLMLSDRASIIVQCLYILNNLSSWRGADARETRETFKRLSQPKNWKE